VTEKKGRKSTRKIPVVRLVSLAVLTLLIVFLTITFYKVIAPFLLPLFLAGVVAVLCQPIFKYFMRKTKNRTRISAALTTSSILLMILIPVVVAITIVASKLFVLTTYMVDSGKWENTIEQVKINLDIDNVIASIQPYVPGEIDADRFEKEVEKGTKLLVEKLSQRTFGIAGVAFGFLGNMFSVLVGGMMFVIALYYFLADGPSLVTSTEKLIPVHVNYQRELLKQFETVVRAVVVATFLAALVQGILTAGSIYIVGAATDSPMLKHFFIILFMATFASLIPVAGTWLIWGPVAVWLGYQGYWGWAISLTLFGAIVIGFMDNIVRTYVLQSDAKLHPLLAFVSVLGGLQVMGLWGVFIGPMVASCLHALIQIFNTELKELSQERVEGVESSGKKNKKTVEPIEKNTDVSESQKTSNPIKTAKLNEPKSKNTQPKKPKPNQ